MNKCYLIVIFWIITVHLCFGQELLTVERKGAFSKPIIEFLSGFPVENGIEYFKITYTTIGSDGMADTASGLIVIPDLPSMQNLPLVIYQHPTSQNKSDVPSAGASGSGFFECAGQAAFGFITISTDYLGLGESRGFHPFVHAATEAQEGRHNFLAAMEYLESRNDVSWDAQNLFLSGYSQGGHASMALHHLLQEDTSNPYPITAAAHMSGPYSLSMVMKDRFLSDEPLSDIADGAYLILGLNEVEHLYDSLTQIFKEPYAIEVEKFANGEVSLDGLAANLTAKLSQIEGNVITRLMFQDTFITELEDPNSILRMVLAENDTYNFGPTAPTLLIYCQADERVPYQNTILADSVMHDLGAVDLTAINISASSGHGACAPFALSVAIDFFKSKMISTGNYSPNFSREFDIYPNPANDIIYLETNDNYPFLKVTLFDVQGRKLLDNLIYENKSIDISMIESGLYYLRIFNGRNIETHSIFIER